MARFGVLVIALLCTIAIVFAQGPPPRPRNPMFGRGCPPNSNTVMTPEGMFCLCVGGTTCSPAGPLHCGSYFADGNLGFSADCQECQCVVQNMPVEIISGSYTAQTGNNCTLAPTLTILQYGAGIAIFGNGTRTSGVVSPFGVDFSYQDGFGYGPQHEMFCHFNSIAGLAQGNCFIGGLPFFDPNATPFCNFQYKCMNGPCAVAQPGQVAVPHPTAAVSGQWTASASTCTGVPTAFSLWQRDNFVHAIPTNSQTALIGDGLVDDQGSIALVFPPATFGTGQPPIVCYGSGLTFAAYSLQLSCQLPTGTGQQTTTCSAVYGCTSGQCANQAVGVVSGHWNAQPGHSCNISAFAIMSQDRDAVTYFSGFELGFGVLQPSGQMVVDFPFGNQYCTLSVSGNTMTGSCVGSQSCNVALQCNAGGCAGQVQNQANGFYPAQIGGMYLMDFQAYQTPGPIPFCRSLSPKIFVNQIGNFISTIPANPGFVAQSGGVDDYGQMLLRMGYPWCAAFLNNGVMTGGCLVPPQTPNSPPGRCMIKYNCLGGECMPPAAPPPNVAGAAGGVFFGNLVVSVLLCLGTIWFIRRKSGSSGDHTQL